MKQIIQPNYVIIDEGTYVAIKMQAHMDRTWDQKFNSTTTANVLICLICKILTCHTSDMFSKH